MLENLTGIKIEGANFEEESALQLFKNNSENGLALLFGKNGAGKSTISRGFSKLSGKEEKSIESIKAINAEDEEIELTEDEIKSIYVFNEDFVDKNIKLDGDATGLETIVVLGKKVELQKQLETAEKAYVESKEEYDSAVSVAEKYKNEKDKCSPLYWDKLIVSKLKEAEGWAHRDALIRGNKRNSNVHSETYKNFICRKPIKPELELRREFTLKMQELEEVRTGKKRIDLTVKRDVNVSIDIVRFKELLEKRVESPILTEREKYLLKIQKEYGLNHVWDIKSKLSAPTVIRCPLCLQELSEEYKNNLFKSIETILNKEAETHVDDLKKLIIEMQEYDFSPYVELSTEVDRCKRALDKLNVSVEQWNRFLNNKINDVYTPLLGAKVEIEESFENYKRALQDLETARIDYNEGVTDTAGLIKVLMEINSDITFYEINDLYSEYKRAKEAEKRQLDIVLSRKKKANQCIEDLEKIRAEKRDIHIAVDDINEGLKYIFFANNRLSIDVEGEEYILKSRGKHVIPNKISVGERNAIALCYFFSNIMKEQKQEEVYKRQYLLVIDDPVSSFDKDNKIGILSYLRREIWRFRNGNAKTKILIMSHDLQTSYDIEKIYKEVMGDGYGDARDNKYCIKELINNNADKLELSKRNEYSSLLKQIFLYAKENHPEYEMSIGNAMRRVLEAYATFTYKVGISQLSTIPELSNKIKPFSSYFESLMYRLVLNGESHSEDRVSTIDSNDFFANLSEEEKRRTAKDVISFLYLLDSYHVKKHLKDVGNGEDISVIEDWIQDIAVVR